MKSKAWVKASFNYTQKKYLTNKLYRLIESGYSLSDEKVIKVSMELDKYIVSEQKEKAALAMQPQPKGIIKNTIIL